MKEQKEHLLNLLRTKSLLKQHVYKNTTKWFKVFKEELASTVSELKKEIKSDTIRLKFEDKGASEAHLFIGSDVLIFHQHTNVFKFSSSDFPTKTSYVQENGANAYCGVINIYDFLADSYEYNRQNDLGYLIGRIFINHEDHFMVEGKGQIGFLYRDFMHQVINKEIIHDIITRMSVHALEFDLLNPPYNRVSEVALYELQALSASSKLKTGKRLGFQFKAKQNL